MSEPEWRRDPFRRFDYRYFDGEIWTDRVSTRGVISTDPPTETGSPEVPADDDPERVGEKRYWDGAHWTQDGVVAPAPPLQPATRSGTSAHAPVGHAERDVVVYEVAGQRAPRDRLGVLVRPVAALGLLVVVVPYTLAVEVAVFLAWFPLVVTGRYPPRLHAFVARYVGYVGRVNGFLGLLTDRWPRVRSTDDDGYPILVHIPERPVAYHRARALFRGALSIPVVLLAGLYQLVVMMVWPLSWLTVLVTGRQPEGQRQVLRGATAYGVRTTAYLLLVTETWPPSWTDDDEERALLRGTANPRPRVRAGEWIAGLGGAALLVVMVAAAWYEAGARFLGPRGGFAPDPNFLRGDGRFLGIGEPGPLNAFSALGAAITLVLLAAGTLGIAVLLIGAAGARQRVPTAVHWTAATLAGLATVLIGFRIAAPPEAPNSEVVVGVGAILGLASALFLTLGAVLALRGRAGHDVEAVPRPRLRAGGVLLGLGAVGVVGSLRFLDWYATWGRNAIDDRGRGLEHPVDGFFHYHLFVLVPLVAAALAIGAALLSLARRRDGLLLPVSALAGSFGVLSVVLFAVRLVNPPDIADPFVPQPDYSFAVAGPIAGLCAALVLVAGACLLVRDGGDGGSSSTLRS